ncbi:MAG: hypothetical protein KIT31_42345 [Deltaproteobacteria bacterium]|nr:hypothetical protein [Deltaproteobacteria bacterium]
MRMSIGRVFLAVFVPLLLVAPACGKSECEALYEKITECKPGKLKKGKGGKKGKDKDKDKDDDKDDDGDDLEMGKDQFVAVCKLMASSKEKDEVADELACAKKDSCEEYESCQQAAQGKKRAARITKDVEKGKIKDAFSSCSWNPEYFADDSYKSACASVYAAVDKVTDPDDLRSMAYSCRGETYTKLVKAYPDYEKVCGKLASNSFGKLEAKVTAARDSGKRDYSACSSLEDAAKTMDGGKEGANFAKAKAACAEMNAAENAAKGVKESKANAAAKKSQIPYQCSSTVEELAKIDTAWGKKTKDELLKACYVELGAVILETENVEKNTKYFCPYQIKEVLKAVTKYDLGGKGDALDEQLKKLPATCTKA